MPRRDPIVAAFTRTRLEQVFRESGETMQAFAGRAGLSTPALSRMLSGARTPGRDSIERIARASGRSPGWFYPPMSGYAVDLEFLRHEDPEVDVALRSLRADPHRIQALRQVFRATAMALAELDLPVGKSEPDPHPLPGGERLPAGRPGRRR